jgi:hypothetical protein
MKRQRFKADSQKKKKKKTPAILMVMLLMIGVALTFGTTTQVATNNGLTHDKVVMNSSDSSTDQIAKTLPAITSSEQGTLNEVIAKKKSESTTTLAMATSGRKITETTASSPTIVCETSGNMIWVQSNLTTHASKIKTNSGHHIGKEIVEMASTKNIGSAISKFL